MIVLHDRLIVGCLTSSRKYFMHNQDEKKLDNKSIEKRKKEKLGMGIAGGAKFACHIKRL
jgi:hypothetical protein